MMPFDLSKNDESARPERLLTVQEVSELLNVPKSYVYWMTHQKKIPFLKINGLLRFRRIALDQWLEALERRAENGCS